MKRFYSIIAKVKWALLLLLILLVPIYTLATETSRKADLDGDGYSETQLFYEGKIVIKALLDENGDGKTDGTVSYKDGFRERAERDINFDGKIDTWIKYYITGVPWIITRDKNGDGNVDYWKYLKNGFIYKREWDRNFDGKPDVRILIPGKADLRELDERYQLLEKYSDENYDGDFEKKVKITKRVPNIKVNQSAGAIGEF